MRDWRGTTTATGRAVAAAPGTAAGRVPVARLSIKNRKNVVKLPEFEIILYHSIALEMLYILGFVSNPIGPSVCPQIN